MRGSRVSPLLGPMFAVAGMIWGGGLSWIGSLGKFIYRGRGAGTGEMGLYTMVVAVETET